MLEFDINIQNPTSIAKNCLPQYFKAYLSKLARLNIWVKRLLGHCVGILDLSSKKFISPNNTIFVFSMLTHFLPNLVTKGSMRCKLGFVCPSQASNNSMLHKSSSCHQRKQILICLSVSNIPKFYVTQLSWKQNTMRNQILKSVFFLIWLSMTCTFITV